MNRIKALPEEVINKIAAGEVIERPANVVKELLENSIDADSSHISVKFESSGRKSITVSDDGCGMSPEDARLCIERHTTSKISDFEDLYRVASLGFRGEALPSIAGVSRMRLVTRSADSPYAWEILVEGGKLKHSRQAGAPKVTTVEINDIFFNTPARRKFLKSDPTERSHILHTVEELAISHYDIGFSVTEGDRKVFSSPPAGKADERIMDIFGDKLYKELLPLKVEAGKISLSGFISRIEHSQPGKNLQYFYINRRPVSNRALSHALYQAYSDSLPVGRHPAAFIFLHLDPSEIDVNVHPTKRTVKFSNENELYSAVYNAFRKCLTNQEMPVFSLPSAPFQKNKYEKRPVGNKQTSFVSDRKELWAGKTQVPESPAAEKGEPRPGGILHDDITLIGQLFNTYILAQSPAGLVIIDQHAANERILFERYNKEAKSGIERQEMLMPEKLELTPHEDTVFRNMLEALNKLGFTVEEFGRNTYAIKSYPALMGEMKHVKEFIRGFIDSVIEDFKSSRREQSGLDEKIVYAACRAAVKAKDRLSAEEIRKLITDLGNCSQPMCCPHGRPTIIQITQNELEHKFGRK
jgi:DNA mismatch repair protein MutL